MTWGFLTRSNESMPLHKNALMFSAHFFMILSDFFSKRCRINAHKAGTHKV